MDLPNTALNAYPRSTFSRDYPELFKAILDLHPADAWQFIYGHESGMYNLSMAPGSGSDMERITGEKVLLRVFGEDFATARFIIIHPAADEQGDEPPDVAALAVHGCSRIVAVGSLKWPLKREGFRSPGSHEHDTRHTMPARLRPPARRTHRL